MMTNLFSMFDPSSSILNLPLNWLSTIIPIFILPIFFWSSTSRSHSLLTLSTLFLTKEIKLILKNKSNSSLLISISIFIFIITNNLLGLIPFAFTSTSHLMLSLTFSLPLWIGYTSFSLMNNLTNKLGNLLPLSTPTMLMPFMALIETLSNIIRPFTLAIRLSANMIAGHLLISLMSNTVLISSPKLSLIIILSQSILMTLELAVSAIQAYVFLILCVLYIKET